MVQIIGHRAYKGRGEYPENTLLAYDKAYEAGVDVIETDIQMSKDGIVVINHDSNTGRIYNNGFKIKGTTWSRLKYLHAKGHPDVTLPSFRDALEWLTRHKNVRLMVDVKLTNEKIILVKALVDMLYVVDDLSYWRERIIFGLWSIDWYEYGVQTAVLKGFRIVNITLSLRTLDAFIKYSEELDDPNYKLYGISLQFVSTWTREFQQKWLEFFRNSPIELYLWTVNKESDIKYLSHLPVAGIITDYPNEACKNKEMWSAFNKLREFPCITTKEAFRIYCYLYIYKMVDAVAFSSWARFPVIGDRSFTKLCFSLLKKTHFI
ncbi:phosphatidylglycerol phospholipase Ecym_2199 [Eremothecium cymbalariae DBVPG|uniref:GP-PDE domain-containing protein n=1 Tax=Eremothecium cymbalariae (strain CBS 270.75 / DBVPG 7215 / KCTC 17166 / NRRL Y-17582) TaxID=931890 RepID=G8JP43_ERECY|nr:Hypothetical protein Ecym_2199 [Eremothecium cymbalariae DBVPG\